MNKKIVQIGVALLALAHAGVTHTRNIIGTPLPAYTAYMGGFMHYPLDREEEPCNCFGLEIDLWGQGYVRSAIDAYGPSAQSDSCSTVSCRPIDLPCVNGSRVPLTQLIFGASEFTLAQAFAGSVALVPDNPFVSISRLSPRFDYNERGAFFGAIFGKRFGCDDQWRVGVRFMIPYRDIEMENTCSDLVGDTLSDVFQKRQETIEAGGGNAETNLAWAARLDFLSVLNRIAITETGGFEPLVIYNNPDTTPPNQITIGGQVASDGLSSLDPTLLDAPFIEAIRSSDGSVPVSVRWANIPSSGATVIQADGSGLVNLARGRFVNNINYAPLGADSAAQRQLWIVPDVNENTNLILSGANIVLDEIEKSIASIDPAVTDFLEASGIDFCQGGRVKGLGDLDMEWYIGRDHCGLCGEWWSELQLGVRFPTGKKIQSNQVLQVIRQPLGNNGHFEIRPGLVLGFDPIEWCKIKVDLTYSFVLKHREYIPASFAGATVANIGPAAPARVSWGYFAGDIDFTFVHPYNQCLGWMIAYEAYAKRKDKICFDCNVVLDLLDNPQTVDSTILVANTNRVAHKIRTEIFFAGKCCNIYAGFAQVVAGHNVSRDTDMYLGLFASF